MINLGGHDFDGLTNLTAMTSQKEKKILKKKVRRKVRVRGEN